MKINKKMVCYIIVLLIVLVNVVSVSAGNHNGHVLVPDTRNNFRYVKLNDTQHKFESQVITFCKICHDVISTGKWQLVSTTNHSFGQYTNMGHNSNGTHTLKYNCTSCDYFKQTTYNCSGNPCQLPY